MANSFTSCSLTKRSLGRAICLGFIAFSLCLIASQPLQAGCTGHRSKSQFSSLLDPTLASIDKSLLADDPSTVNSWVPADEVPCNGPQCRGQKGPVVPSMVVEVRSERQSSTYLISNREIASGIIPAVQRFAFVQNFDLCDGYLASIEHPPRCNDSL